MTADIHDVLEHVTSLLPADLKLVDARTADSFVSFTIQDDRFDRKHEVRVPAYQLAVPWWRAQVRRAVGEALRGRS